MNKLKKLQKQFEQLMDSQKFVESELDYTIVENHIRLIKQLEVINTGAMSLFDLFRREHAFYSPKFESVFGWDLARIKKQGVEYSNSRIHPDDFLPLMEAGNYFISFALSLASERRADYKVYLDYRIKGVDDEFIRVLEQQSVLESDHRGNAWLAVSVLDISPYSDIQTPVRSRMINVKTGELYLFPPPESKQKDLLTMREKEILHLISKGLISREIADMLYISVNTVNTHRQRIIERLDVSSTSEAIRYAMDLGILPIANC